MYWTDWGETPKVERAKMMDGSDRKVLIDTELGWPNALVLDLEARRIYFGDAELDKVEVANLDGTERGAFLSGMPHLFGMTSLGKWKFCCTCSSC